MPPYCLTVAVLHQARLPRAQVRDVFLAVALLAAAMVEFSGQSVATAPYVLAAGGVTLPLALCRRAPLGALALALGSALLLLTLTGQTLPGLGDPPYSVSLALSWLTLMAVAGAHRRPVRAYAGLALGAAAGGALTAAAPRSGVSDVIAAMLFSVAVPWLLGALWRRRAVAAEQSARADRVERAVDAAVADERARIAREIHDVVAHNVSMMVVQSEAADVLLDADPERARESLHSIGTAGRDSLVEMRRLLGMVRADASGRAPQPKLRDVAALAEQMRVAGLPVELNVQGEPVALAPGIELSAYRIVQESLTNALRHSDRSGTTVLIRYEAQSVELEIQDRGAGQPAAAAPGHGLVGVRERVAMYGGVLEAGPVLGRGFRVRAVLPAQAT